MKFLLTLCTFFLSTILFAQTNWMSTKEVEIAYQKKPKPILIFIHADWCKICKMQDANVFENDSLSNQLNEQYYNIRLNAEDSDSIAFFGRNYAAATVNSYHGLATYLGKTEQDLSFPTTVLLNDQFELAFRKNGLMSRDEFWLLLSGVK